MASQAYKRRDVWGNVNYAGRSTRADAGTREPWQKQDNEHLRRSEVRRDPVRNYDAIVETYPDDASARAREAEWIERYEPPYNISGNRNNANRREKYERAISDGTPDLVDLVHADDLDEAVPEACLDRKRVMLRRRI